MSKILTTITEGVHELFCITQEHDAERSAWELRSEYRRLKQMHNCDVHQIFPNSRMLPSAKTFTQDEALGKGYWNHTRRGVSFDCCQLHRSRKQILLQLVKSEQSAEHKTETPVVQPDELNVVAMQRSSNQQQNEKRKAMMDKIFNIDPNDSLRRIRSREFGTTDMQSLRYQLQLTKERLENMQRRSLKQAS